MTTVTAREEPMQLERHGIDYIPPTERHGKPYTLFLWAAHLRWIHWMTRLRRSPAGARHRLFD